MEYGRLGPSETGGSSRRSTATDIAKPTPANSSKKKIIMLSVLAGVLIVASAISAVLVIGIRARASGQNGPNIRGKPTQAISRACSKTRFPALCIDSLLQFPGSTTASEQDLVHISFNMTLQHLSKALDSSNTINYVQMDPRERSAYEDCLELLDDSVEALSRSLFTVAPSPSPSDGSIKPGASNEDVATWLSAALTNQDTCTDGFSDISGTVKDQMANNLKDLSELVSNCLAIFSASGNGDFSGVPIQNRRRLMSSDDISEKFPKWLSRRDRKLLSLPVSAIQADIIVSKGGNGTFKTIGEAIKKAPEHSSRRVIIYVRAGR